MLQPNDLWNEVFGAFNTHVHLLCAQDLQVL